MKYRATGNPIHKCISRQYVWKQAINLRSYFSVHELFPICDISPHCYLPEVVEVRLMVLLQCTYSSVLQNLNGGVDAYTSMYIRSSITIQCTAYTQSVYLFCLYVYLSIHPSICLSIHPIYLLSLFLQLGG
jgi:hypothetical protein